MQFQVEQLEIDLTAYEAFCQVRRHSSVAFLESLPGYGKLSRYSILAINPYLSLRGWPDHSLINGRRVDGDPLEMLKKMLLENWLEPVPGLPLTGGCIGAIAYDAGFGLVDLPLPERTARAADATHPLISFDFYDNFLIFDHQTGRVHAQALGCLEPPEASLNRLKVQLNRATAQEPENTTNNKPVLNVLPTEEAYVGKVEQIRQAIFHGDVYIANLTHLHQATTTLPGDVLYQRLRRINPAPFAAFLRQGNLEIISASPERLIRIDANRRIETRPIKGTRPRGENPETDQLNARELLQSEKDRSELLMIVDLERNDLSRICQPESVRVDDLFKLETYPTVFHLVAVIRGILQKNASAVDCLRAVFPGGSITGAPKVAAMQIIDQLEDQPRGFYTGCLGYFSLDGQADFNILIRSIIKNGEQTCYGSGGGITWESAAVEEYQEMLVKADPFFRIMR